MVYELTLWRQAKAIPDHWDLTISPPPGWSVASAEVEGDEGLTASVEGGGRTWTGRSPRMRPCELTCRVTSAPRHAVITACIGSRPENAAGGEHRRLR